MGVLYFTTNVMSHLIKKKEKVLKFFNMILQKSESFIIGALIGSGSSGKNYNSGLVTQIASMVNATMSLVHLSLSISSI